MQTFNTRSQAANRAIRDGVRSFRTYRPAGAYGWVYSAMQDGPGIDLALMVAAKSDFVHHVEIDERKIPYLIVTCRRDEITETIPHPLTLEPITPELWDQSRSARSPVAKSSTPRVYVEPKTGEERSAILAAFLAKKLGTTGG